MLKNIKNFFKYFFENSTRAVTSIIIIALACKYVYINGFFEFTMLLIKLLFICVSAMVATMFELIIHLLILCAWYKDPPDESSHEFLNTLQYIWFVNLLWLLVLFATGDFEI